MGKPSKRYEGMTPEEKAIAIVAYRTECNRRHREKHRAFIYEKARAKRHAKALKTATVQDDQLAFWDQVLIDDSITIEQCNSEIDATIAEVERALASGLITGRSRCYVHMGAK